jgi:hypothetical protein
VVSGPVVFVCHAVSSTVSAVVRRVLGWVCWASVNLQLTWAQNRKKAAAYWSPAGTSAKQRSSSCIMSSVFGVVARRWGCTRFTTSSERILSFLRWSVLTSCGSSIPSMSPSQRMLLQRRWT